MKPALLLLALLLVADGAGAGTTYHGTTSTGDADTWVWLPSTVCLPVIFDLVVTLTLLDPAPLDAVLLTATASGPLGPPARVATAEQPVATVRMRHGGCSVAPVTITVDGLLVEGEAPYRLDVGVA